MAYREHDHFQGAYRVQADGKEGRREEVCREDAQGRPNRDAGEVHEHGHREDRGRGTQEEWQEGKKGKKKAAVQSWKKQSKGTRVNLEAVLFSIEQLRSSYIELSESVQYLIGICYLLRVRYLDQQRRARQASCDLFTSKRRPWPV